MAGRRNNVSDLSGAKLSSSTSDTQVPAKFVVPVKKATAREPAGMEGEAGQSGGGVEIDLSNLIPEAVSQGGGSGGKTTSTSEAQGDDMEATPQSSAKKRKVSAAAGSSGVVVKEESRRWAMEDLCKLVKGALAEIGFLESNYDEAKGISRATKEAKWDEIAEAVSRLVHETTLRILILGRETLLWLRFGFLRRPLFDLIAFSLRKRHMKTPVVVFTGGAASRAKTVFLSILCVWAGNEAAHFRSLHAYTNSEKPRYLWFYSSWEGVLFFKTD